MNTNELFIDANKLPQPLPKSQVNELLDKVKHGDEDAIKMIIEHNIRLVLYQVNNKFKSVEYDKKDLVSIGNIGLIKAVTTFDKSKNVEFATYATRCIDNEILMFLRKLKKDQKVDSLDKTITHDKEGKELKIEDTISDENDIVEDYEKNITYKIIREIVKELPSRDREIIMLHFGFYNNKIHTQKEIADMMSISQSYVSRLITKIVKKLGIQLKKCGVIETTGNTNKKTVKIDKSTLQLSTTPIMDIQTQKNIESKEIAMEKSIIDVEERSFGKMRGKKLQTIYKYLNEYTREKIDAMLNKLTEEEISLVKLRYGNDLDNPVVSSTWGKEETTKFYGSLIPKMKRLLSNPDGKRKRNVKKTQNISNENTQASIFSKEQQKVEDSKPNLSQTTSEIEKDDCLKILELMRTPSFGEMLKSLTPKEAVIICLKLGYVDEKYFTTESIAGFLGIETSEVIETIKKVLLVYKENINQFIDKTVDIATSSSLTFKNDK